MDTDDIPVLTEVYQTDTGSASLSDDQLASIKREITDELKETLGADLKKANATIEKLEAQLTSQSENDSGSSQALEEQHQGLLADAKNALAERVEQLSGEHSEKMNLDIAAKITGMQELAVSQVKAQLASSIKMFEENLKTEVTKFKEKEEGKLKTNIKDHFEAEEKAIKEAFDTEQKKLQETMQKSTSEQSLKLTKEATDNLKKEVGQLAANHSNQINQDIQKQLSTLADNQKDAFLAQLDKELPAVKKVLEERVDEVFAKALPDIIEQINTGVMALLQDSVSQVKLVLPDTMPKPATKRVAKVTKAKAKPGA